MRLKIFSCRSVFISFSYLVTVAEVRHKWQSLITAFSILVFAICSYVSFRALALRKAVDGAIESLPRSDRVVLRRLFQISVASYRIIYPHQLRLLSVVQFEKLMIKKVKSDLYLCCGLFLAEGNPCCLITWFSSGCDLH